MGGYPENLVGIDVFDDRVSQAKRLCSREVQIHCGNAARLPFENAQFDLVVQLTVFSSILDLRVKEMLAWEMLRVMKAGGLILWHDFFVNNPSSFDVRRIGKKEILRLFAGCHIDMQRISLALLLAHLLATYSWLGCYLFERARVFNTHYLGVFSRK